ncbi:putative ABC transporter arginine-binding protein 2 isoform X1 [Ptychodera flava]|uniref:putative ABC transporter arginine-binding protein 2 isoform X1 n=1 Tax=Ptychodera flava TaxID=63121 RepID=UPI003969EDAC
MVRLAYIVYVTFVFFAFGGKCFDILEFNDKLIDNAIEMNRVLDPDSAFTSWIRMIMKSLQFSKRGLFDPKSHRNQDEDLLRKLAFFRVMEQHMEKTILYEVEKEKERVYTIATYLGCDCPLEYIDEARISRGFDVDLINAVCTEAGRKCVHQDVPHNACLTHVGGKIPHAGTALLGKQIDMCLGWAKTPTRQLSVAYTAPYARYETEVLFVIKFGNPGDFDPNNVRGKTIGFEDGFFTDKACLVHARDRIEGIDSMQSEQEVYKDNYELLLDDLRHDKIDAFLTFKNHITQHLKDEFEFIGDDIGCVADISLHGIKRKDNPLTWFDDTLKAMKENGKYHALCHKGNIDHGHMGKILCMEE